MHGHSCSVHYMPSKHHTWFDPDQIYHRRSLLETRLVSTVEEAWTIPSAGPFRFFPRDTFVGGLMSESSTLTSATSSFDPAKATAVVTLVSTSTSPSSSLTSTSTFLVAASRSAKDRKFAVKSTL